MTDIKKETYKLSDRAVKKKIKINSEIGVFDLTKKISQKDLELLYKKGFTQYVEKV